MAEFVNKVKKNDVEYEIRDARIPEADAADAGKVLKVADAGGYELGEADGGTQLYKHRITCKNTSTSQDRIIVNVISSSATPVTDRTTWFALWNGTVHYDDMYCMKESDGEFHSGFYSGMKGKFIYRVYTDFTTYTDEEYDYDKLTDTVTAL